MRALCAIGETEPTSHFTTVGDQTIHHLEIGSGPPVVLVHGAGGGAANWYKLFGPISAAGYRVLAPDLPGFGLSDPVAPESPLGMQAAWQLAQWLDAIALDRVALAGTSFGGLAVLRFAQHFPARVQTLMLIDSAGGGPEIHGLAHIPRFSTLRPLLTPSRTGTRYLLRWLLTHKRLRPDEENALVEYMVRSARRSGTGFMVRALRRFIADKGQLEVPSMDDLVHVTAPTMVVWGAKDAFFPAFHALTLQLRVPNADLHLIEDAGHSPNWERPDVIAKLLLELMTKKTHEKDSTDG